ncbi:MAG: cytochrome C [Gammaproteobacteria bacterium]|nr:cytochrome C [Gammaproteobacteria bacterium]
MKHFIYTILFIASTSIQTAQSEEKEDKGKQLFDAYCTACHGDWVVKYTSGYTKPQWKNLISNMVDFSNAPEDEAAIIDYLVATYPINDKRQSVVVPGKLKLKIKKWKAPTLGQRTRDPVEASDGTIWWVGQSGNILGKINPETDEMKEYTLPKGAMPHSVSMGPKGNPWYMGNKNGSVGYLDLKTEQIVEFKMPIPEAKDPHTGIFDKQGILWFTLQQSNMIGRLNPETGEIKLVDMSREKSRPYGIKLDAHGDLYVACNGSNCLVKVDHKTMKLTEIDLPTPGTTVRRLAIDKNGMVWFVNSSKGKIGRYNPDNGKITEWPNPSGEKSHPYAMEVTDDGAVWFNESSRRPETLVRFDPKTETFQSWVISSGGADAGLIRHMRASKKGILIHQTSTNHIMEVSWE